MSIESFSADLVSRIPAMAADSPINNAEVISNLLIDEVTDFADKVVDLHNECDKLKADMVLMEEQRKLWEEGCLRNADVMKDSQRQCDNQRLEILGLKAHLREAREALELVINWANKPIECGGSIPDFAEDVVPKVDECYMTLSNLQI